MKLLLVFLIFLVKKRLMQLDAQRMDTHLSIIIIIIFGVAHAASYKMTIYICIL